jgi:putative peptide zinc metalloprotease protein
MGKQTFYDQWHRIAELRLGLRPSVSIRQHRYRDEIYYVYHEVIHSGFFRARPETHDLIQRIKPNQTLHDIWRNFVEIAPKTAPGQKDFFDLIAALYRANLVYVEGGVSEARLMDRAIEKKKKPFPARVSELLFFRIPLFDPEPILKWAMPAIRMFFSLPALVFVSLLFLWAGYEFLISADRAYGQSKNILQMGNLIPLYLAMIVTHIAHEFSHAALCKYFGGSVRTMGIMLLMFTPLPYADVSSSWAFRNKWARAAVGAAGMYSDMIFCSIATILWAYSPPGTLNEVAMNLMFVTAVYTALFNANPLMRFDGYYILSDLVEIPNLHQAAQKHVNQLFQTKILGESDTQSKRVSRRRTAFLVGFFSVSNIYRLLIMIGIVKFVADQYFGLGLVVAIALGYSAFIAPTIKFIKPLGNPRFMAKHRKKIFGLFAATVATIVCVTLVPLPYSRTLDGVIQASERSRVFIPVNGIIKNIPVTTGDWVQQGDLIIEMQNPELELELQGMHSRIQGLQARIAQSMSLGGATVAALEQEYQTLLATQEHMKTELAKLSMHAPHAGIWTAPNLLARQGQWISRGTELGVVADPKSFEFRAVLKQQDASEIAAIDATDTSVKIEGLRANTLNTPEVHVIPYSQKDLPSAAVSPLAGGDVALDLQNRDKAQAVERFFLIMASVNSDQVRDHVLDGRRGWLHVSLPPRSLGKRAYDGLRQFFQQRYKL